MRTAHLPDATYEKGVKGMSPLLSALLAITMLMGISTVTADTVALASETVIKPIADASALAGARIPAAWFTESTAGAEVISATLTVSDTNTDKQYVEVFGYIYPAAPEAPNIEWQALLPLEWNGRTLQMGGDGNNGSIPNVRGASVFSSVIPVDEGYVVYGDDSGHQSQSAMDASFAGNAESRNNYIRAHLIKAHQAMLYVTKAFYGVEPVFNFFAGNGTGGREGLACATNFGAYYDGIFCSQPSSSFVLTPMWGAILSQAVYESYNAESYPYSDGFIDEDTIKAITQDAIKRYDALDGIKDGVVSNVYTARAARGDFLAEITDKYNLTKAQLKTLDVYEHGIRLDYAMPNGMNAYHGYAALEGGVMELGPDPVPREPLDITCNVPHGARADGVFKHFITNDPTWVLLEHDYYHPDDYLMEMLMAASKEYDANSPAFDDFIANNGKLILFAGWHDMSMSPWQLIQQYRGYVDQYGQESTDAFCKFYLMPGVTHGAGMTMDYLTWLDTWCSTGGYPGETLYGHMTVTGGQMPMAAFPGWVKYVDGNPLKGESYTVSTDIPEGFWGVYD